MDRSKPFESRKQLFLMFTGIISLSVNAFVLFRGNPLIELAGAALISLFGIIAVKSVRELSSGRSRAKELLPFSLLVENSGDFIAMSDENGVVQYMNEAGRKMVGLTPGSDLTKISRMDFYSEEMRERINGDVVNKLQAKGYWSGEVSYRHQITNDAIPTLANYIMLRDPLTQAPMGMAAVSRDIRDRRKLER